MSVESVRMRVNQEPPVPVPVRNRICRKYPRKEDSSNRSGGDGLRIYGCGYRDAVMGS